MGKSVDELNRKIAAAAAALRALEEQKVEAEAADRLAEMEKNREKANELILRIRDDLQWLDLVGLVPTPLIDPLTDKAGKFNPGRFLQKIKSKTGVRATEEAAES